MYCYLAISSVHGLYCNTKGLQICNTKGIQNNNKTYKINELVSLHA